MPAAVCMGGRFYWLLLPPPLRPALHLLPHHRNHRDQHHRVRPAEAKEIEFLCYANRRQECAWVCSYVRFSVERISLHWPPARPAAPLTIYPSSSSPRSSRCSLSSSVFQMVLLSFSLFLSLSLSPFAILHVPILTVPPPPAPIFHRLRSSSRFHWKVFLPINLFLFAYTRGGCASTAFPPFSTSAPPLSLLGLLT
jgi:hypothetical protein